MAKSKEEIEKEELSEKEKQLRENRARFVEAAERRAGKAIAALESLKQLTSDNYAYTPSDVKVLEDAILASLKETTNILLNPKTKKQVSLFAR